MQFSRDSLSGQTAIECIMLIIMMALVLVFSLVASFGNGMNEPKDVRDSVEFEQTDNADAAKSQAADRGRQDDSFLWWLMNNQMLMNMSNHSD